MRGTVALTNLERQGKPFSKVTQNMSDRGDMPSGVGIGRIFHVNAFQYPAPGVGWTPTVYGAYLAASLAAKKVWLPLNFLKEGDVILNYHIQGDAIMVTALTLDCKLVRVNLADPLTTTDITGGAITQVVADGVFSAYANPTNTEITVNTQYLLEILGTTAASDGIYVIGAKIVIARLV